VTAIINWACLAGSLLDQCVLEAQTLGSQYLNNKFNALFAAPPVLSLPSPAPLVPRIAG